MIYEKPSVSVVGSLEDLTGSRYAGMSYDDWNDFIIPKGGMSFDVDQTEKDKHGSTYWDGCAFSDYPSGG